MHTRLGLTAMVVRLGGVCAFLLVLWLFIIRTPPPTSYPDYQAFPGIGLDLNTLSAAYHTSSLAGLSAAKLDAAYETLALGQFTDRLAAAGITWRRVGSLQEAADAASVASISGFGVASIGDGRQGIVYVITSTTPSTHLRNAIGPGSGVLYARAG